MMYVEKMTSLLERLVVRISRIGAFAVPLAMGILAASPEPYWLDSPEFTAAAQTLGVPHPPGHPLYVMLVKPFTLLPLGSIALRVSIASALFGAVASFLLFELVSVILKRATPTLPEGLRAIIALAAAFTAAAAPGWWFQCVRAEVYSLQILLVLAALYPLVSYCLDENRDRLERLYLSAFFFGLGLANHHFIMLAALPAAILPLVFLARERGGKGALLVTVKLTVVAATGLLPYLFLPLRSAAGSPISLGGVHTLRDFFWVVSARVYQKSMAQEHLESLDERSLNAVFTMMSEIGPVLVVASLAGFYYLLRRPHTRIVGLVLALLAGVTILLRTVMGFDPFNPDYYGYMLPVVVALIAGAAVFAAVAIEVIRIRTPVGKPAAVLLTAALLTIPVTRARDSAQTADLSDFRATRLFYDLSLSHAETGTLVLASYYKLFFVLWSAPHIDGSRPDITVINPQLFGYPGYLTQTLAAHQNLRPLAWSMIVNGAITESSISELALNGPLRVEPSPWVEERAAMNLVPDGVVYRATPEPMGLGDINAAVPTQIERWKRFYEVLGSKWQEHETWRMLSWFHYLDALFLAKRGATEAASEAVSMALALGNTTPQILGLEKALKEKEHGPIDVEPFMPTGFVPTSGSTDGRE